MPNCAQCCPAYLLFAEVPFCPAPHLLQPLIKMSMPSMLEWILGGYNGELRYSNRKFEAREEDKPKV